MAILVGWSNPIFARNFTEIGALAIRLAASGGRLKKPVSILRRTIIQINGLQSRHRRTMAHESCPVPAESTLDQTTDNQERELRAVAERLGHEVVEVYADNGISGAKGREKRPAFNRLCRDMTRRRGDIIMAWSVDRLGRSLQDLVAFLSEIHASRTELYLHQQGDAIGPCHVSDDGRFRRV